MKWTINKVGAGADEQKETARKQQVECRFHGGLSELAGYEDRKPQASMELQV
jgi:hypothetical protein